MAPSLPPPRVLVCSTAYSKAAVWAQALIEMGCAAQAAETSSAATLAYTTDAALLLPDALDAALMQQMRKAASGRAFPIICAKDGDDPLLDLADDRLPELLLPSVAAPRLRSAFRVALAEEEIETRRELFAADVYGCAPAELADGETYRALFVGRPSAAYLRVETALAQLGLTIEASPVIASALDYAQDNGVDVVVADGSESSDDAMRFCLSMRANAAFHHVPGVLLTSGNFDHTTYAMTRGVSEIMSADDPASEIARRLVRLARQKRRMERMKKYAFAAPVGKATDASGLFTRDALAHRLQRHIAVAEASARSFSVALLRLEASSDAVDDLQRIAREVGGVLRRLLRIEDTAGTFNWRTFAVLMPASNAAGAKAALTRLTTVLEANVLQHARVAYPDIAIHTSAAEFKPGEAAGAFLLRAAAA